MTRKIKFSILLLVLSLCLCLLSGELLVRVFKTPLYPRDPVLGWIFPEKIRKGEGKYKVLIIGDSFTQARGLDDLKAYYDYLLPLASEMRVYGIGAFGTYQEYLLLKKVLKDFSADVIIWQFCPNDFINNIPQLERSFHSSLHVIDRPFLLSDGSTKFGYELYPDLRFVHFFRFSRLFLFLYQSWQVSYPVKWKENPEKAILNSNSLTITSLVLQKVKGLISEKSTLMAFTTESSPELKLKFYELARAQKINVIPVAEKLEEAKSHGKEILGADRYHWNELGHQIVGKEILRNLE